jgi:cyanate lyase
MQFKLATDIAALAAYLPNFRILAEGHLWKKRAVQLARDHLHICEQIGGYSEVLIVGAILGQMKLTKPQAANAGELFALSPSEAAMLNEVPMRGEGTPMPPTDPLIYRFTKMVMVNGPAWKALLTQEFGDGIMGEAISTRQSSASPTPRATASRSR